MVEKTPFRTEQLRFESGERFVLTVSSMTPDIHSRFVRRVLV